MRRILLASILFISAGPCALADDAKAPAKDTPEEISATKAHNEDIVARSPGADGVFVVQGDGTIKHVQSGMECPAKLPNVQFWHAEVFKSPAGKGVDVGCDYGRNGADGKWVSKLTIFATKAPAEMTLDQAFVKDRGEVIQATQDATSIGTAMNLDDKDKGLPTALPEWRSEAFLTTYEGKQSTDEVVVAVSNGWILEIRTTYLGKPNNIVVAKDGDPDDAALALGDRIMATFAYVQVGRTIDKLLAK